MAGEIRLDRLRTFLEVYRAGSLSRAARSLGISQPSVTAHVSALEQELRTTLFERAATGVTPTARADTLAAQVAPHVDALDNALWDAGTHRDDADTPRVIHVAGPAEYMSVRVLPRLKDWLPAGSSLRTRFGLAEPLLTELLHGIHDIVISSVAVHRTGLQSLPLCDEEFALVASPSVAQAWSKDGELSSGAPLIAYAESLPIVRRWCHTVSDAAPHDLNLVATVPDLRAVTDMVAAGLGLSVLPTYLIEGYLTEGALVEVVVPEVRPLNTLFLVTRTGERSRDRLLARVVEGLRALES